LLYSVTAFGGPQGHLGMMLKNFVSKRKYISEEELMECFSFCQLLPGASSTQTITLIGFKRGGLPLAIITLFIWILPASFLMGLFSFVVSDKVKTSISESPLKFLGVMAIGFLVFAAVKMFTVSVRSLITQIIMLVSMLATFLFFRTPWIFPLLIVSGCIATNLSSKRIPETGKRDHKKNTMAKYLAFCIYFSGCRYC